MVAVTYVSRAGEKTEVAGELGDSVMQTALAHDVDGIVAECGGSAMCATCHVYVDEAWVEKLPEIDANEDAMLDSVVGERRPTSRLSCQIPLSDALDGIVLHIPEAQV